MADHLMKNVIFSTEEKYLVSLTVSKVDKVVHQVDSCYALYDWLAEEPRGPHHSLPIGVDDVCSYYAFLQLCILVHENDLTGIHHSVAHPLVTFDRFINQTDRLSHR